MTEDPRFEKPLRASLPANWPETLVELLRRSGSQRAIEQVIQWLKAARQYDRILEVRLLAARHRLGLPLIHSDALENLPDHVRQAYEDAYVAACREVGRLYLDAGDIPSAWPYFRAIDEPEPVAQAIEALPTDGAPEEIIQIAFHEQVNPTKGFRMILDTLGTCAAVTALEQYAGSKGRRECIAMLVAHLHGELLEALRYAVAQREGRDCSQDGLMELIEGRDWLFADNTYFVDTSHLSATVRFATESDDPDTIRRAIELCEYGRRLSPMLQYRGFVPFEDVYNDCLAYLKALAGEDPEPALALLEQKAQHENAELTDHIAAQVKVNLLCRLGRYQEAVQTFRRYLSAVPLNRLYCPTVQQLCALAGDPKLLCSIAREDGDVVGYLAGIMLGAGDAQGGGGARPGSQPDGPDTAAGAGAAAERCGGHGDKGRP